ncbi:MAG: hypothetical protein ACRC1K_13475, partial [Planctomycetia bacterium]
MASPFGRLSRFFKSSRPTAAVPRAPRRRLSVESLEDRSVPALTTFGGGVLTIDFNAVNESVAVTTSGSNIVLTGSTFTGAGGTFATANVNRIAFTDSGANE